MSKHHLRKLKCVTNHRIVKVKECILKLHLTKHLSYYISYGN
jgi:hypothetical protein